MKKTVFLLSALSLFAALPAGYDHFTAQQLAERTHALNANVKDGLATETLAKWGNHLAMLVHRTASGEAEFHENQADIIVVRSGAGSIIVGGEVEGGKTTAPGEIRGSGIKGGEKQALHTGDLVHVPPKTPHQVVLGSGQTIDYFAIKVDAQ